jgi:hypothetical protein
MISKTKQAWTPGAIVNVGFMTGLLVVAAVPTPGDFAPDAYVLSRNNQFYAFVPHNGLIKIDLVEAREMVADAKLHAERAAAEAIAKADDSARHIEAINELLFA